MHQAIELFYEAAVTLKVLELDPKRYTVTLAEKVVGI